MGILDEAKKLIGKHPDQAKQAIDKGEDVADEKTGGKYTEQIETGGEKLGDALGLPED
jgi:hypothetical protein